MFSQNNSSEHPNHRKNHHHVCVGQPTKPRRGVPFSTENQDVCGSFVPCRSSLREMAAPLSLLAFFRRSMEDLDSCCCCFCRREVDEWCLFRSMVKRNRGNRILPLVLCLSLVFFQHGRQLSIRLTSDFFSLTH